MSRQAKVFECAVCGYRFEIPFGVPKPSFCPRCGAPDINVHRSDRGRRRRGRQRS